MRLPTLLERLADAWIATVQRRPRLVLLVVAGLTLAAAAGLTRLELRMDGRAMVPPDDPAVVFDHEVREAFGLRDPLVVLLDSHRPDGLFDEDVLRRLADVTEALREIDAVPEQHLVSLATERRDRVYPGTLKFRPFLDPFPDTPLLMDRLREDIDAAGPLLDGTLVSHDRSATALFVGVPEVAEIGDRGALYHQVVDRVRPFADDAVSITVVGAPAAEALLGHHILGDMARLLPLSLASMALLLLWRLGRVWAVLLGLAEVGACLAATFGLMGWFGVPLSLTSGVLPLVLISLGLADEIHLVSHVQKRFAAGDPDPIGSTYRALIPPILVTSLTTSFGLLSFLASPIAPIRQFGAFAAIGILFCFLFSITAVPAAVSLLGSERLRRRASDDDAVERPDRWLMPIEAAIRHPRTSLLAVGVLAAALASGIGAVVVQDGWIDGFAPDSAFRQDTARVDHHLLGTHSLWIHLDVEGVAGDEDAALPKGDGREGWLIDPPLLDAIGRFEEHIRGLDGVGGVLGPHTHLSTVAHLWKARKEGSRRIPEHVVSAARVYRYFDIVRGKERRREVVNDDLDRALVHVFLEKANYRDTAVLIDRVMAWDDFAGYRVELAVAGDVAVSQAMIPAIVRSQVTSLVLALAGALLVLTVLLRSPIAALVAIAPVATAVACVFGAMGRLGIPLGVATSMFCAITLGVGVDYAIHFVAARQRAIAGGSAGPAVAALRDAGPAILTDAVVITVGFAWMLLSSVPANARLGVLVAVALGLACAFTLVGLGAGWSLRAQESAPDAAPGTKTNFSID
ncbi:MAG: MMPL family transporter [Acidobacteriota bacterium]